MKLNDYLKSINKSKENVIRDSDSPNMAEKLYPDYISQRILSYHKDCILLVNELNTRNNQQVEMSKRAHYEFLLNIIPVANRFDRLRKPETDDNIENIKKHYGYSTDKAREVYGLFSKEDFEELKSMYGDKAKGGIAGKKGKK